SADKGDNLELVALGEHRRAMLRSRDDLAVALDRDLSRVEPELAQQVADGPPGLELARLAVEDDRRHGREGTRFSPPQLHARSAPISANHHAHSGAHHKSQ